MRLRARRLPHALCVAALAALILAAPAAAQTLTPFGHTCQSVNGVRFCPTTEAGAGRTVDGVPSFDGVPLDVDVTLPPTGNGPFPTIVMIHGWGNDKTDFEASTPEGDGNETYHYNNIFFAKHGYAVVNYSARGWAHSCGGGPTADHTGACAHGYIRLDDTRYEARDAQWLLGLLVDEGITKPHAIGVTGVSYGGGLSLELAYLKNRVRLPSGRLVPWKSPNGTRLSIAAAYPRWEWSDLVDALLPNGRFLDFKTSTDGLSRTPIGVPIQSYINGLFALGNVTGYYCGDPPATPCTDANANLPYDYAQVLKGEPFGPTAGPILNDIYKYHQAFGLPLPSGGPSPLLLENGWTDDLFTPSQALRVYNQLRAISRPARVTLQFGDLGHSRGSNKVGVDQAFQDQAVRFFNAWLKGKGKPPAAGAVEAFTQTCPATGSSPPPEGGPYRASSWRALHPVSLSFGGSAPQTVTASGDFQDGPPFDPIPQLDPAGTSDACRTISPGSGSGTAVYELKSHGFTLLGLPTVRATIQAVGPYGELDSRLYDVLPDGTERLISRATYRLLDNQSGRITFQLHGNGYRFASGDEVKLELRGNDAGYYRPSNDQGFTVTVSKLRVSLPLAAGALHATVRPRRVVALKPATFRFSVTTRVNGSRVPVRRAIVAFHGHSVRTDSAGAAALNAALPPGSFKARVSKLGFRTVSLTVTARRPAHSRSGRRRGHRRKTRPPRRHRRKAGFTG